MPEPTDGYYYQRPRHEDFELAKVIHAMQEDDVLFQDFMRDREAFLADRPLDDEARALLVELDYAGLVARGIHPMLAVQLQRRVEWNLSMAVSIPSETATSSET